MIATVALSVMQRLSQNHRLPHTVETLTVAYTVYLTAWQGFRPELAEAYLE